MLKSSDDPHATEDWKGLKEIDRAIAENRLTAYTWNKTWADPWGRAAMSGVLSLEHRAPLDSGSRAFSSTPIWVACWRGYRSVAAGPCHHWIVSLARPQVPVTS